MSHSIPVFIRKGLKMSTDGTQAAAKDDAKDLVSPKPKSATLVYHSFNIAFVLVIILYIVHVVVYYNASEVWWQALVAAAIVSPLFVAPLYYMPMLRDFFVEEYGMGSHDNLLASETLKARPARVHPE